MKMWPILLTTALLMPVAAMPQGTSVPFSGLSHDSSLPVEITADQLQLDQAAGSAVFQGQVRVAQGELRMAADRIEVFYTEDGGTSAGQVHRMQADGNVMLSNGAEAAEAETATYEVASGIVQMAGNVLLTQGNSALTSESLRIDLNEGTGLLDGRVKTIFQPEENP